MKPIVGMLVGLALGYGADKGLKYAKEQKKKLDEKKRSVACDIAYLKDSIDYCVAEISAIKAKENASKNS